MKEKIIFQKNYTRDTALFLQEIWAKDQSINVPQLLGKLNPHLPGIIHYVNNGGVEIWEHKEATQWLLDNVYKKNTEDSTFFEQQMEEHEKVLQEIKPYWGKKVLTTKEELIELSELFRRGITGFNVFFRTAQDDRTPKDLRDKALAMREKDVFFSQNDLLLHASITTILPEVRGYENYIFASEIINPPSLDTLIERKKNFVLIDGVNTFLGDLEQFATKNSSYFFEQERVESNINEFKGQIGYKGKVSGPVKILLRREQNSEVKEGDILVSPMTTPDFLPAMQKAAAFITDEGGITCHAAIVSRELKKPCILGTKIATQVLKDGDIVEVDADSGIVRIIK